jgi:hypothetical protein
MRSTSRCIGCGRAVEENAGTKIGGKGGVYMPPSLCYKGPIYAPRFKSTPFIERKACIKRTNRGDIWVHDRHLRLIKFDVNDRAGSS